MKTVTLTFKGSKRARAEFLSAIRSFPGVETEEVVERLNIIGNGGVEYVLAIGLLPVLRKALANYLKSTKQVVDFFQNGRVKRAVNYSPEELQKLRQLPEIAVARKTRSRPTVRPDWGVIEGFAAKPKKQRKPKK